MLLRPEVHFRQPRTAPYRYEHTDGRERVQKNTHAHIDVVGHPARIVAAHRGRHQEQRQKKIPRDPAQISGINIPMFAAEIRKEKEEIERIALQGTT